MPYSSAVTARLQEPIARLGREPQARPFMLAVVVGCEARKRQRQSPLPVFNEGELTDSFCRVSGFDSEGRSFA
jgi:hypothetical protein